jgi:predicted short-subunit dehydrogenase-like oxidoreductase (DUF2520 family)
MVTYTKESRLGFIGAGVVGGTIAVALSNAGYKVATVASRTFSSASLFASRLPGCQALTGLQEVVDAADFVFITTSDDAIGPVCASLTWRPGQGLAHCSGAASVDVLQHASDQGAGTGAFHPLQAFNSVENGIGAVPGTTFGIEGGQKTRAYLSELATAIGGKPIFLRPEDKVLYHVSGVLMGNLLTVLGSVAASVWTKFGYTRDDGVRALAPMMRAVAANLEASGVPQAVAGPYPRGDIGTIRKHLDAVSADASEYLPLYCELALAGLPFAVEKGALGPERAQEIRELVGRYATPGRFHAKVGD